MEVCKVCQKVDDEKFAKPPTTKTDSSPPENWTFPNEYSNHQFSGAKMLVSGRVHFTVSLEASCILRLFVAETDFLVRLHQNIDGSTPRDRKVFEGSSRCFKKLRKGHDLCHIHKTKCHMFSSFSKRHKNQQIETKTKY